MIKNCYIHIPFCKKICAYCDFCKVFYNEQMTDKYLKALDNEIKTIYNYEELETIYIGGGTPSSLSIKELEELFEIIKNYTDLFDFSAVVPVSAKNNEGIDDIFSELSKFAVPSVHFFDDEAFTDQPERVITAEIIREKLLRSLDKEIPHGIAVDIERFSERQDADILDIDASIYCERQSHKGIVIGKGGKMLKKIGIRARHDLEEFFEIKVNLKLWVKVKENWRTSNGIIHGLGLD